MLPRLFLFNDSIRKFYTCFFLTCLAPLIGCEKRTDLSSTEPYARVIGKSFVLQQDYYIFCFDNSTNSLIGRVNEFPAEVSNKYVGEKFGHAKILGCASKGQEFFIQKVEREETFESSYENYYAILIPKNIFIEVSLLATSEIFHNPPFTKTWSDPPIFDPKAALPLPSDGIWWK